ncbi:protein of unknown function [Rhodonellum ikkaensis]|nr:protein of unknown function [Rhodonellum ikkaensis]
MAAFFAGLGSTAYAQKTATAPASATILADLTIELDGTQNEIAFGNLSASTTGPVILDANGLANSNTGTSTNVARFDLGGADGSEVTVSFDEEVLLEGTNNASNTMTMTSQVVGTALAAEQSAAGIVEIGDTVSLVLNQGGTRGEYFLWVGGSFPALAGQNVDIYAGTFNINVEYN